MSHQFVVIVEVDSDDYENAHDYVKLEMEGTVLNWHIENAFESPVIEDEHVHHMNNQGD